MEASYLRFVDQHKPILLDNAIKQDPFLRIAITEEL